MRRPLIDRPLLAVAQRTHVVGQLGHQRFELVDAAALLVDGAVERIDQVFLVGQLEFDGHETVVVAHGRSLQSKPHHTAPLGSRCDPIMPWACSTAPSGWPGAPSD